YLTVPGASRPMRDCANSTSALRVLRFAQDEKQQQANNETRNGDHPEHHAPEDHFEKLRCNDRHKPETTQRESTLLQTVQEPAPARMRGSSCGSKTRRAI